MRFSKHTSGSFQYFFHKISFDSKILSRSCDRHQKFDYKCSSYPGNESQSPDFCHFLTIFNAFQVFCLWITTLIFLLTFSPIYVFLRVINDFFMTVTNQPKINTTQTRIPKNLTKSAYFSSRRQKDLKLGQCLDSNELISSNKLSEVTWPSYHLMDLFVSYRPAFFGILQIVM